MAQETVSYLQNNCQNQNCKTFPSLPVHRLISLFSYRSTWVLKDNHGYELSLQTTPPPTHPLFFYPVHMHTFWLFALLLMDRLTALAHSQVENKVFQGQQGFSMPSQLQPPKETQGRSSCQPRAPPGYQGAADSLAVDSSTAVPWFPSSSAGLEQVPTCLQRAVVVTVCSWWLTRRSPNEADPEHWETLPALCKWEKREEGSSAVAFFRGDQCWVKKKKKGSRIREEGKLKSLEK